MAIANACRIPTPFCADLTEFDMSNESEETFTEDEELEQLLNGDICFKIHIPQMQIERLYILSGYFNPSQEGHLKLLEVATSICGYVSPCFELSAINADKPPLSVQEITNRVKQFEKFGDLAGKTVIISNQPFFYKKAELFPASAVVISADTTVRLLNVLEDFDILDVLKDMFISIPADTFRMDISPTEIRSCGAQ